MIKHTMFTNISFHEYVHEYILPRVTSDSYVNKYGKWLIDLCADNQLYILNGRTLGDLMGKFTCHTPSGSSIVDYFIASSTLSTDIQSMFVNDLSLLSDHCMLTLKLKISIDSLTNDIIDRTEYSNRVHTQIPDVFAWSSISKTKYQEAFNSSQVKMKIENLNNALINGKVEDAEPLVQSITNVMVTAGNMSLFRKSYKHKRKKHKKVNKKWYDKDCQQLLREVKSMKNTLNRNSTNACVRIKFYKKFKEYKRIVKLKKRNYKNKLTNLQSTEFVCPKCKK